MYFTITSTCKERVEPASAAHRRLVRDSREADSFSLSVFYIDELPDSAGSICTFSFEKARVFPLLLFRPLSLEVHQLPEGIVP
jgi:hypothetical protein